MRPRPALVTAVLAAATLSWAAGARAEATSPFEVMPRHGAPGTSYRAAWVVAITGAALVAGSFPLAHEADRRYAAYLVETDVARIDARFDATTRMDRLASASLLTGEGLLATAVWLRFVHRPREHERVTFVVEPARCAVALRF